MRTSIKTIEIEGININDLPISFADSKAFEALGLDERPALLLGLDSPSLFDRVEIDFPNKRVVLDMPSGVHRETRRRSADARGMRGNQLFGHGLCWSGFMIKASGLAFRLSLMVSPPFIHTPPLRLRPSAGRCTLH